MLPVQDDLGDVVCRVKQVVVPPFVPVDGHGPVLVHAGEKNDLKDQKQTNIHRLVDLLTGQSQTLPRVCTIDLNPNSNDSQYLVYSHGWKTSYCTKFLILFELRFNSLHSTKAFFLLLYSKTVQKRLFRINELTLSSYQHPIRKKKGNKSKQNNKRKD